MNVNVGVIGCGNIARFHFNGLEKAGAAIIHIADINRDAAEPWVNRYNARFSQDYRDVLDDSEVDVVSILASAKYHREMITNGLEAGKDIIVEKTMTNSAEEADGILRAARQSDNLFFTGFMKRFFPAVEKARELLPSLGRIFSANVRTFQQWGDFYTSSELGDFAVVHEKYGGAILKCAGSHMLDLMCFLIGLPKTTYAHLDMVPGTGFDRKAGALFEYHSGATVLFEATAHPLKRIGYERNSWDEYIQINGTEGRLDLYTVTWDAPECNPALLVHYDNGSEMVREYRFDPVNPFDREMAYFCHCIDRRVQGYPSVEDGYHVDILIDAMVRSSQEKCPVTIAFRDRTSD